MLQMSAVHSQPMYGMGGLGLVCKKGKHKVMKVRAALLKFPPKAVADGDKVCTMVNWQMLYMNENTPERNNQAIVCGLYVHVLIKICQSVMDGLPTCFHSPGTGLETKKTMGNKNKVAGMAMYTQVSNTLSLVSPNTPAKAKLREPHKREPKHAMTPMNLPPMLNFPSKSAQVKTQAQTTPTAIKQISKIRNGLRWYKPNIESPCWDRYVDKGRHDRMIKFTPMLM